MAIRRIPRVQCTVDVGVAVRALRVQFPCLLPCRTHPSTLPFQPGLGVRGLLGGLLSVLFGAGIGGPHCCPATLGPLVMGDCSDLGNSDAWALAPFPAVSNPIRPSGQWSGSLCTSFGVDLRRLSSGRLCCSPKGFLAQSGRSDGLCVGDCAPLDAGVCGPFCTGVSSTASPQGSRSLHPRLLGLCMNRPSSIVLYT